jgi:(1->4)-alpha-D-glucan 1-alpha-D-glucosylmutase
VRARINVLSEIPDEWKKTMRRWSRLNRPKKQKLETTPAPSKNDEYALYQTLVGAWPFKGGEDEATMLDGFCRRVKDYMIKAVREAKIHSSWINPNIEYEDAVVSFIGALFKNQRHNRFLQEFLAFQSQTARFGIYNSLSQVLLKLTCPGVPDIYQGNEVWNFSLVDPDNRRHVDFSKCRIMLEELQSFVSVTDEMLPQRVGELMSTMEDGRTKLYVTWKTLSLRWAFQDVFRDGIYVPLAVHGQQEENLCAFARQHQDEVIVVAAPRLYARLCGLTSELQPLGEDIWSDTWLEAPFCPVGTEFRNAFTRELLVAESCDGTTGLRAARLLTSFPVALLTKVRGV